MAALVKTGFDYASAWHMSPLDTSRYLAIDAAWSIPPEDRDGGVVMGTAADAARILGGG